jgi:hypothetical protein
VKQVKSAVIQLPDPKDFLVKSFTSIASAENNPELPDSQEMAPPSQDTGSQKRQKLPPKAMLQQENDRLKEQLKQQDDQLQKENNEQKDRVDQLIGQIDLLLKQQTLLLSQIEKGSNTSSKLQSSETSGLSQVFKNQSLLQQSNPDTTSLAGNDDSPSNLASSITSNTSLSHRIEPEASQQPKKRRAAK